MNERIRVLAVQAGITTNIDTDYFDKDLTKWLEYYSEKLAQSVIQECMGCALWVGEVNKHPIEPIRTANAIVKRMERLLND